jgi:hypothetical protein
VAHERDKGRGRAGLPQEGMVQQLRGTRALQQEMSFKFKQTYLSLPLVNYVLLRVK